jgi:hypothetical protein
MICGNCIDYDNCKLLFEIKYDTDATNCQQYYEKKKSKCSDCFDMPDGCDKCDND